MVDTCVVCGDIVPEGVQVCPQCYQKRTNARTRLDDIRTMSVEELAYFICKSPICSECMFDFNVLCGTDDCLEHIKNWLLKDIDR